MSELEKRVMEQIEAQKLSPRPLYVFLARRAVFWFLALLSFFVGAVCFALAIFVASDFRYTGGKGLDEMPFDEYAWGLPVLWLISTLLLAFSATYSLAHTKRGYRCKRGHVLAVALFGSVILGAGLYGFDVGGKIHHSLSSHFPAYRAVTHIPYAEWSRPEAGFLGGEVKSVVEGKSLTLRAFNGEIWTVDIATAVTAVSIPLIDEGDIAIEGLKIGELQFRAVRISSFD